MKIGMTMPIYARYLRGDAIWAICEKGKEIGVDAFSFEDHVIVTPQQTVGQGNGFMDIWTAMSYVAAVTNVQSWSPILCQAVVVIPYRPAIQQAKVSATVDSLSGGRLMIGAGTGYNKNEFDALGLNVHERGDLTDEYLKAMIELWTHPVASFHGKYVNFDEMTISVRPTQQPHPPILVGAIGKRPFQRIAEYCQGWAPMGVRDADALKSMEKDWVEINALWKEHGREGKPYFAAGGLRNHLISDRGFSGGAVVKGITDTSKEGEQPYIATFPLIRVADMVKQIRAHGDIGADLYIAHLPSYRYQNFANLEMILNQMEMYGEVLAKIPHG